MTPQPSPPDRNLDLYRPNVGLVVFNREGRVWLGRRIGGHSTLNWQFPQGGVDPGEDWEAAARRELHEETGIRSVTLLGQTEDWIVYDFPADMRGRKAAMGYRGQKQKWFAFRFDGDDREIDLRAHVPAEFDAWRWAALTEVDGLVVSFKREAYRTVIGAFQHLSAPS